MIKMDIAKTDLEKRIQHKINNTQTETDEYVYKLFIEIFNVLKNLKYKNLYHMDIKPVNILMKLNRIDTLEKA